MITVNKLLPITCNRRCRKLCFTCNQTDIPQTRGTLVRFDNKWTLCILFLSYMYNHVVCLRRLVGFRAKNLSSISIPHPCFAVGTFWAAIQQKQKKTLLTFYYKSNPFFIHTTNHHTYVNSLIRFVYILYYYVEVRVIRLLYTDTFILGIQICIFSYWGTRRREPYNL
jgi:hypothetical protein